MWLEDLLRGEDGHPWTPSIHMPRWANRMTLELTDIRCERLQEIREIDARAEGAPIVGGTALGAFRELWKEINGPRSWDADPWVWALEFEVHRQNVDAYLRQQRRSA